MIWDSCLCRAVAAELTEALGGSRARGVVLDRGSRRVSVHFREQTWTTDLSGARGWTMIGPAREPPEEARRLPALLTGVEALPDERILLARFRRVRGRKPDPTLILELAPNRWNAIWTEGEDLKVVARLRLDVRRSHTVGQPWSGPDASVREGVDGRLPAGRMAALFAGSGAEGRGLLLRSLAHLSSLNVDYVLAADTPTDAEERWRRLALLEGMEPGVLRSGSVPQPYPWPLGGQRFTPAGTLLSAMAALAEEDPSPGPDPLLEAVSKRVSSLERRKRSLAKQIGKAGRADALREQASLILTHLHELPHGAGEVTVPGLDGNPVSLTLDPARRPQDEAEALFKRARRLDRARETIPREIESVETELERLTRALALLASGSMGGPERRALERFLGPPSKDGGTHGGPAEAFRRYRSSGGLEIWVGRNSKRNDELTFRHGRPGDVWLHARHASGAHVILRWDKSERPPRRDLEEAAILAALHSKARGSAHVPVDWTRRRYVRKARGAPAGTVRIERHETLFVTPDPGLEAALREEEPI